MQNQVESTRRSITAGTLIIALAVLAGCASVPEFPAEDGDLQVMTTPDGVEFVRTPDKYFEDLRDWPYEVRYVEIDGLRQAYIDEGTGKSGETILLLHGQPAWSYLYRDMIPSLIGAGHRVIAMDHVGMGRSDKPIDLDYHSYLNHTARLEAFIVELGLSDITAFVQDWGSLIGLYVIGTNPDLFERVVVADGKLPDYAAGETPYPVPTDEQAAQDAFHRSIRRIPARQPEFYDDEGNLRFGGDSENFGNWILYTRNDERFRVSQIVEALTYSRLSPAEERGYDAPFPARIAMAAPRSFPGLANTLGGVTQEAWVGLRSYDKPFLTIWATNDPLELGSVEAQQILIENVPGAEGQDHARLPEASHFLQDDQGEEIVRRINAFIEETSTAGR